MMTIMIQGGIALVYAAVAYLSIFFAYGGGFATFVWPPAGIAFAVGILGGPKYLPGIFVGVLGAALYVNTPYLAALVIATGCVLEPLTARFLLGKLGFDWRLLRKRDGLLLLAVGVLACTLISAFFSVAGLWMSNAIDPSTLVVVFRIWWFSNMTGVLLLAPMALVWWRNSLWDLNRRVVAESTAFIAVTLVIAVVFFFELLPFETSQYPLGSVMLPFVLLASIRFGARATTLLANLLAMVVVVGAAYTVTPMAGGVATEMLGVWMYAMVLGLTTLGAVTLRSEQERAMADLQQSEETHRALIENINDVIFNLDTTGTFSYISPVMRRISQYTPEEVIDRSFMDFVHPDDVGGLLESLQRTMAGETDPHTFRVLDKDGAVLTVKTSSRLLVERDEVVGVSGIMTNVSREVAMAAALRESEERLQLALAGAQLAMWDWNIIEGNVYYNERWAAITGYPEDALESDVPTWAHRIHPEDQGKVREAIDRHLRGETELYETEHRVLRADGSYVWVLARGRAFAWNEDGHPTRMVGTYLDMTEWKTAEADRRQLEAQIQHAQKLESLGVLAGGIAHDFNNLLVGILGNADLGLLELPQSSPGRTYFHNIVVSAQRAADLCKQMLAYSGKGRFVIEGIHINGLIEEMIYLLEVSISKNAVLKCRLCANLPAVEGDPTQIRQVIMNLITNASEALEGKSGVITITTELLHCDDDYLSRLYLTEALQTGLYVCIEVSDTGCGMDLATLDRIYEPFFTTKFTGRGLGMAAVLGIVRGHKGAIKVYSEKGRGTTFKVLLPAAACALPQSEARQAADRAWRGTGTILVIDDEPGVRAICKETFQHYGLTVLTAADGVEGLEMYKQRYSEVAAVLLDMTMPRMNGDEVYREMRGIRPDVRVVLTSGYNEQEATSRFAGKGLAGFIQKPFRTDELVARFRDILGPLPESDDDTLQ